MFVLFRSSSKTVVFSRFLKMAVAKSDFMNEDYNCGFVQKLSVSILKEIIPLV